ncbi:hypothetical protein NC651_030795 [Populus alba x Populus x berolinensis]|nr:hypothetical protein NC651_030795 [Populus alba x Populus x berolinensis]
MDKKEPSPKDEIVVGYFHLVMTLSILFFNACPKKSLKEISPVTGLPMSRAKEETRIMTGNLLVVAVLVAGVTFAGVIQFPQLRDNNNSSDRRHEFNSSHYRTYESLLNGYLPLWRQLYSFFCQAFILPDFKSLQFGFQVSCQFLLKVRLPGHLYYGPVLVYFYSRWWLPNKLSDLKKKHNL